MFENTCFCEDSGLDIKHMIYGLWEWGGCASRWDTPVTYISRVEASLLLLMLQLSEALSCLWPKPPHHLLQSGDKHQPHVLLFPKEGQREKSKGHAIQKPFSCILTLYLVHGHKCIFVACSLFFNLVKYIYKYTYFFFLYFKGSGPRLTFQTPSIALQFSLFHFGFPCKILLEKK